MVVLDEVEDLRLVDVAGVSERVDYAVRVMREDRPNVGLVGNPPAPGSRRLPK